MEIKFANEEQVIKSWDYAKSGKRFSKNKVQHNLTLTNKRVIATSENATALKRDEVPIKSVKTVSGEFRKNGKLLPILKIVFGALFTICIIGIIFKGFGIKMLAAGIAELKSCVFELTLVTAGEEGSALKVGASSGIIKKATKFKVYTDKAVAREIINEVGAIVADNHD